MKNNLDIDQSRKVNQFYRVPFLELGSIRPKVDKECPKHDAEMNVENLNWIMAYSVEFVESMKRYVIKKNLKS